MYHISLPGASLTNGYARDYGALKHSYNISEVCIGICGGKLAFNTSLWELERV